VDHFVREDDTIQYLAPFYISYLFWRDEDREKRLEPVRHDFGYELVYYIAQCNRPVFVGSIGFFHFHNEYYKRRV